MKTLTDLLEAICVDDRALFNEDVIKSWWPETFPFGVSTADRGVIALFMDEEAALHFRLALINQELNKVKV